MRERSIDRRGERDSARNRSNSRNNKKERSPDRKFSPRRRSVEKRRSIERRRPEKKDDYQRDRNRSVSRDRIRPRYSRKRSVSKSKSPIPRKISRNENPSSSTTKEVVQKESKDRQSDRSLSYSPARRNPERYKEILESKHKLNEKPRKQTGPVVKLQSDSSDDEQNDVVKEDDFLIDRNQDKEFNRLKALKTELAAKVKESLEKKIISEAAASSSQKFVETRQKLSPEFSAVTTKRPEKPREMPQTVFLTARDERKANVKSLVREAPLKKRNVSKSPDKSSARTGRKSRSRSKSSRGGYVTKCLQVLKMIVLKTVFVYTLGTVVHHLPRQDRLITVMILVGHQVVLRIQVTAVLLLIQRSVNIQGIQ